MGYIKDNCAFAPLTSDLQQQLKGFDCKKEPKIEQFFREESVLNDNQMLSQTYCFYQPKFDEAVCGFCVSSSSISTRLIPKSVRNKLNRKIPYIKQRDHYPAVIVGQLAVFDKYASMHLGDELMQLIKYWVVTQAQQVASRYLLVDAVNHPAVLRYYERNGFFPVYRNEEEERAAMEVAEDEALRTRFMICDLITFRNSLS